jgi:hypothetical protein
MRLQQRLALMGFVLILSAALLSAADEPAPLLKAIAPAGGNVRVRFPISAGHPKPMTFSAQVPRGKRKSELVDVVVAYDSTPNPSYVTAKKLESWGYDLPKGAKEFVLPELYISAAQIAPKAKGGADVVLKMTNVKLTVVYNPGSTDDTVHTGDLCLSALAMFQNNERFVEPRLSFADKFIEMTVPGATIAKRPGTDTVPIPDVSVSADAKLVPSMGVTTARGGSGPWFVWASIDGQDSYKTSDGKVIPVNCCVSSITNMPDGIQLTIGLARGVKIEMDEAGKEVNAVGVENKSGYVMGKIKELRIELMTGPGFKTKKDLVLKDQPVYVDRNVTEGYMSIGQRFMDKYVTNAVYAHPGDGWKLYGRISPEFLLDIKTRKKP